MPDSDDDEYEALPCVACGKKLAALVNEDEVILQPVGAVTFTGPGNYGSTVWDPMTSDFLIVNICDDCIRGAATKRAVQMAQPRPQPTTHIVHFFDPERS